MTRKIPLQQVKVFQILPLTIRHINCTKPNKMNFLKSKLRVLHEWIWQNLAPLLPNLPKLCALLVIVSLVGACGIIVL